MNTSIELRAEAARCRVAAQHLYQALHRPVNGLLANYLPNCDDHLNKLMQIQQWCDNVDTDLQIADRDLRHSQTTAPRR